MTSTISASAERELKRRAKHKLAVLRRVEEVSGSVAATCRYFGITRTAHYKWRKRYEEEGFAGLRDRSSVPHRSPNATSAE
ncbi:MAG: transposase [Microbacteriaceae bacterium]|nr:transposase [Microbacteriaceae bacterium]